LGRFRTNKTEPTEKIQTCAIIKWNAGNCSLVRDRTVCALTVYLASVRSVCVGMCCDSPFDHVLLFSTFICSCFYATYTFVALNMIFISGSYVFRSRASDPGHEGRHSEVHAHYAYHLPWTPENGVCATWKKEMLKPFSF